MSYTPGPWVVDLTKRGKKVTGVMVVAEKGGMPGLIVDEMRGAPTPTDLANARLIAAAPELVEALEGLLSMLEPVANSEKLADEYINARALLSRIKGEA